MRRLMCIRRDKLRQRYHVLFVVMVICKETAEFNESMSISDNALIFVKVSVAYIRDSL